MMQAIADLGVNAAPLIRSVEPEDGGPVLYSTWRRCHPGREEQSIAIRLAQDEGHRNQASMVVNRRYGARGYGDAYRLRSDSHTVVFTATADQTVFGTITLTADRPGLHLACDETFPEEVAKLRRVQGSVVCELTKFAFDTSPESRPLLASLFHIVYLFGIERYSGTDLLIEVNPRHVRFYETMLGFRKVGAMRLNRAVDAPSQLMHVDVSEIGEKIAACAGQRKISSRSLYPYFFAEKEEFGIRRRVREFTRDRYLHPGIASTPEPAPALADVLAA